MAEITDLLKKLKDECREEKEAFSGKKERSFFIELMGAEDVEGLLRMYDPKEHGEKWAAEYPKKYPDIDKLMQNGRAVDFMSAGTMGCIRHYVDDELRAHVVGRARMNWNANVLDQTKDFMTLDYSKKK